MSHRKKDWERLSKKYDPKGEYQKKYDAAVKSGQAKPIKAWAGSKIVYVKKTDMAFLPKSATTIKIKI